MNIFLISSIVAFIASLLISTIVFLKGYNNAKRNAFITIALLAGTWCLYPTVASIPSGYAFFWVKIVYIFAIFTGPAFLRFGLAMAEIEKQKFEKKLSISAYLIAIFFLPLLFSQVIIKGIKITQPYPVLIIGSFYPIFIMFFGITCLYSFYKLLVVFRHNRGQKRNQIKYVFIAYFIAFLGAVMHFGSAYGLKEWFPHDVLIVICMVLLAYTIAKYRLMDIKVAITRATIFIFVYTLVLGIPFLIGYHTKAMGFSLFLMFIFATVGPVTYRILQRKAENILLAKQKRYQRMLLNAAKGMVSEHDLDRLLKLIVHVVKRAVKIEFAAIFIDENEKEVYKLAAVRDHHKVVDNISFSYDHSLINLIKQKRGPLTYEDIALSLRDVLGSAMHLIVPSMVRDNLLAFLVLGEKEDHTIYTMDDINVFNTLSRQAALAIEHCLFLKEFKEAQEKIFQAEKLASIGGMASGIAHQIRNRLNHFAVAVGELKLELKDIFKKQDSLIKKDPTFKGSVDYSLELAESIDKNVKRTAAMITGMLDFAHAETEGIKFSQFSLKEIVDLTIVPLKTKHNIENIPLEFEYEGDDAIEGIKSQFVEVILNILDNAYEAIKEKAELRLSEEEKAKYQPLIKINLDKRADSYFIKISDNGVGVKEEDKQRIFAPFFTTKSSAISGTGIGMYVVKRMIEENHNGRIWFESEYMKGTEFYIELPRKEG
jgi:signal transduction histidine kinase